MNISSISKSLRGVALLVATLPFTLGTAEASLVTNATWTTFDVGTGQIDFEWDQNSQYDITGTDVIVKAADILQGGASVVVVGTVYEFVIPNFYDPLPLKTIKVTMRGANAEATSFEVARVLDIIGADADFDNGGPAVPVDGEFVEGKILPTEAFELWHMYPNPDFEIVKIYAPIEFELQSITIHTQSLVPVPAAVWLFGSGLLGLVGIARRKKTA